MRIFGLEIKRAQLTPVPEGRGGWRRILEPFSGAWQRNIEEKHATVLCYPTLYACLTRVSRDIGTMPFVLKKKQENGVWVEVENTAHSPVLRKPNHYQTDQQFRESWVLSLLIAGNAYILKERDNRGVVVKLYVLDPRVVLPMVTDTGDVYYQINYSSPANLLPENYPAEQLIVPSDAIIHDRVNCFEHQLVGIPPLYAAHWPAVKNLKILRDATNFFANGARPSGILTVPAGLSPEDADAVQQHWNQNYTGENSGKVALIGADVKYVQMGFNATDSQVVAQLEYSDRQICQPFGVPPYIVGIGEIPAGMKTDEVSTDYYKRALQPIVESMERLLDDGLSIARPMGVELDAEPLLRMDVGKQTDVIAKQVGGKLLTPDEGRARLGYGPTGGGNTLWGQNQDYPLGMLADRAEWDPDMQPAPAAPEPVAPEPVEDDPEDQERAFLAAFERSMPQMDMEDFSLGAKDQMAPLRELADTSLERL